MKQLLSLALALLPCLAWAQYPSNGNQKITLGEQTTADGLIWRGIRADTTSKIVPFSDTSAYIILDTVEKTLWLYKAGQVPKWQQVGGSAGGGGGSGTVTSITGGTGLTGGTITTSGTLAADTSFLFTQSDTLSLNLTSRFATKLNISDTLSMLSPYFRDADTTSLNLTSRFAAKQNTLTLTTTGSSGAATLVNSTLNIPQYSTGGGVTDGDKGDIDVTNSGATWTIDTSAISLSDNKVTGTLPVANGGTGQTTLAAAGIVTGTGTTNYIPKFTSSSAIGNSAIYDASGSIGIATTTNVTMPLTVQANTGNGAIKLIGTSQSSSNNAGIYLYNSDGTTFNGYLGNFSASFDIYNQRSTPIVFYTNGSERMRITSGGNVGIGTTSDASYKLYVSGNSYFAGTGTFSSSVTAEGGVYSGNGLSATTMGGKNAAASGLNDKDLTLSAWYPTSGTNEYGGDLYLSAGRPTGSASGKYGTVYIQAGIGNSTSNVAGSVGTVISASNTLLQFFTASSTITSPTERMRITSGGEVWIGYTTDQGAYPLQVNGQILATSSTVATPSDKKYKENITPLTKGLEIVNKLKPVTFNFVNDTENNFSEYEEVGFIAQDVDRALSAETFAKSIVKQTDDSDPNSTYLIGTGNLIPILTKAIQEQTIIIKQLEDRIKKLEEK